MKRFSCFLTIFLFVFISVVFNAQAGENKSKFYPGKTWNDTMKKPQVINAHGGCVIFHEGLYYWYGEHKVKGLSEKQHADAGIHCYASKDLYNWFDMGMMLPLVKDTTVDLSFDCNSDRPKVVYNEETKMFVAFFKLYLRKHGSDVGFIGIATSVSPTGPFVYSHKFLGGNSPEGTGDFAMFKDDDGSLYHLTVRKPDKAFVIGKMRDDYMMPEGEYNVCENILRATEAPAVFKKDGIYHMLSSGSSGWKPCGARYYTSNSLFSGWEYHGNPCEGVNPNNEIVAELTFGGQSNYVLKVEGEENAFIAMFDINKPDHPYESGYIWLPILFENMQPVIEWKDEWDVSIFNTDNSE